MLFSKRKKAQTSPTTGFRYDLPIEFRNQVIYILRDSIGYSEQPFVDRPLSYYEEELLQVQRIHRAYGLMCKVLCDEYGVPVLPGSKGATGPCQALRLFLQNADPDRALDAIELSFRMIPESQDWLLENGFFPPMLSAPQSVEKLNARFKEHAIGYRFEQGRIIRIDSEYLQATAVEPSLHLMHVGGFDGALEEFMLAHKYYRQGPPHYDDCLTNCLKAVESTLQQIIILRRWEMPGEAKFDNLFTEVKKRGLFPPFLSGHLGELKKFLQTVAVIRNEEGAHGSGSTPNRVPEHLVAYQIHLAASAIVFLIGCNEVLGKPGN